MTEILTFNGGMDQDTSPMFIKKGDVISRRNARVSVSGGGDAFVTKPLKGTISVPIILPIGVNKAIGDTEYLEGGGFIFFNYNSKGNHGIYWYTGSEQKVLLMDSVLEFTPDMVVDCRVIGDLLIWTENVHDPRVLSIERALNYSNKGTISGNIYEVAENFISGTVKSFVADGPMNFISGTVRALTTNTAGNGDITGTVKREFEEAVVSGTINEAII